MDYGLYLATVVGVAFDDSRLRIKILPHMAEISDKDCPLWPFFFKDELLMAQPGNLVWVICDNEFSTGYVLGMANFNTYSDEPYTDYSIPKSLKERINEISVDLKAEKFEFLNLKVTFWNKHCIHFVERRTGGVIYAYDNGTLYIFRPDEFQIKIGKNIIKMDKGSFAVNGIAIKLQSSDVELGKNPTKKVLTTLGAEASAAEPSKYVKA